MIDTLKRLAVATGLAVACGSGPALSEDNPVVVELYTSQGCSSCPPADELMHELAGREDVIALALHVDYWDYIGWKDAFADPAHTARQRDYARAHGRRSVYTPQMIVNGQDSIVGARAIELAEAIMAHAKTDSGITLALRRTGERLRISAQPGPARVAAVSVTVVRYHPRREVDILRGENAGRHAVYSNVVEEWRVVGEWSGAGPLDLEAAVPGTLPVVVLLQESGYGPIVAAARLR